VELFEDGDEAVVVDGVALYFGWHVDLKIRPCLWEPLQESAESFGARGEIKRGNMLASMHQGVTHIAHLVRLIEGCWIDIVSVMQRSHHN